MSEDGGVLSILSAHLDTFLFMIKRELSNFKIFSANLSNLRATGLIGRGLYEAVLRIESDFARSLEEGERAPVFFKDTPLSNVYDCYIDIKKINLIYIREIKRVLELEKQDRVLSKNLNEYLKNER